MITTNRILGNSITAKEVMENPELFNFDFSDRFLAAISGTKDQQGNSPRAVGDALRSHGVPLEEVWPFSHDISTFENYYAEIPDEVKQIAKEFTDEWVFSYENVPTNPDAISAALKCSPLLMSVYAWLEGPDGRYIRPPGYSDIHATTLVYERVGEFRRVFDTYADGLGDPAIKDVHWEAMPEVVKRFYIKKRDKALEISLLSQLLGLYQKLLELLKLAKTKPVEAPTSPAKEPESLVVPEEPVRKSRIIEWAKAIEIFEDAPKSWNNPGAIRAKDGTFLKFKTYDAGFEYLCDYLTRACTGKHPAYKPEFTLLRFFETYAPQSDNNNPLAYARFVASRLGLPVEIPIKELV